MLRFVIWMFLCLEFGDAFPQRNKPDFGSNFDFDSYLEHFTEHPMKQTMNDHPIALPNQDYRYIPLLGERPDYIPPLLRTHFPKKSVVKQRAWHSSYQDGNFPRPGMAHAVNAPPQDHVENLPRTHFSFSAANSNFHLHSKIEDFGAHGDPVMEEDDYDLPLVEPIDVPLKEKPHFNKHSEDYHMVDYEDPMLVTVEKERPIVHPEDDEYDLPIVESVVKVSAPEIKTHDHSTGVVKFPSKVKPITVKYPEQYDSMNYEEPVETLSNKESAVHKHDHMKQNQKLKRPNVNKHVQKQKVVKSTKIPGKVHNKQHSHRPTTAKPVHKHDIKQSTTSWQPIIPSYTESYEATHGMEALTKKESVSIKEHSHKQMTSKPVIIKHEKNPIEPSLMPAVLGYPEDDDEYDLPIVEVLTKEENIHIKDHNNKLKKEKPVKKHSDKPVSLPSEKPSVLSYPVDYEDWSPIESLSKKENHDQKFTGQKKQTKEKQVMEDKHKNPTIKPAPIPSYSEDYKSPEVIEGSVNSRNHNKRIEGKPVKHSHTKVNSKVKNSADEYKSTETKDSEEYGTPVISQFHHKENDYDYEDLEDQNVHVSKEHSHIKTIKPTNAVPVTKSNGDEYSTEPTYQEDVMDSKSIVKESKNPASEGSEIKRIVKREVGMEYEDYDSPLVEAVPKETLLLKVHEIQQPENMNMVHKPANENPMDDYDEYDYELPVVEVVKNPIVIPPNFHEPVTESPDYDEYDLPIVEVVHTKKSIGATAEETRPTENDYDYNSPVEAVHAKKSPADLLENAVLPGSYRNPPVVVETLTVKPVAKKPSKVNLSDDYDLPIDGPENPNLEELTKEKHVSKEHDRKPVKKTVVKKEHMGKKPNRKSSTVTAAIQVPTEVYGRYKRERENYGIQSPAVSYPRVPEDIYERPIDKYADINEQGHRIGNEDYFEVPSIQKENPIHGDFESLGVSDNQVILDSISINREGPEGREIPVLDVLAVEDREKDPDSGIKVVAFNKENGNVDVINIGHENSNHPIEDFADSGSGADIDERSSLPHNFLPMNSNAWSFMTHVRAQERRKFKPCFTPKNETGNCMPIQMCPVPNIGAGGNIDELLRNICIIDEVFIGICCPEFPVESVRVDWGHLGNPNLEPLVDNGQESDASSETKECGKLPSKIRDQDPWPWMAPLISTTSDRVFCGGVLINKNYVLTAAHCTSKIPRNRILVRLGSPDSQTASGDFAVVEIKRHAQYNPRTMQNDIALLKLSRRVPIDNFRRLVCLPDGDLEGHVRETAVLLRWQGTSRSGVEALPVISNQDCQNRLGTLIGDSVLCTEPRSEDTTCNADSGAPLVIEKDGIFTLTGVLTWNRNDCNGRFPSVFTRISTYQKWIENHVK